MKAKTLTLERVRQAFGYNPDTGELTWLSVANKRIAPGARAGSPARNHYLRVRLDKVDCYVHRLIWFHQTGEWPPADIDHINGDRADNRWCNLRAVTRAQNQENQARAKSHNRSGLLGAHKLNNRYASEIKINGVRVKLGLFDTAEQAHQAYLAAKAKGHKFASRVWQQDQQTTGGNTAGATPAICDR